MKLTKADITRLLPPNYLPRQIEVEIEQVMNADEVIVIYGARQVGKSSLILKLAGSLVDTSPVHYYTLDEYDNPDFSSPDRLLATLQTDLNSHEITYLLIDEAQRLEDIGLFIKQIYDRKLPLKILLSGSASFTIKNKVQEPLTGRKFEFHLSPFTIQEILKYKGIPVDPSTTFNSPLEKVISEYMIYGGYPKVFFTEDPNLKEKRLVEIVNTYVTKDLVQLFALQNPNQVRKVTTYIAENIGNILSVDKITLLGGMKRSEVELILEALTETFLTFDIYPYSTDKFKEISRRPKVYFHDVGLRNAFIGKLNSSSLISDTGHLFENVIGSQLLAKYGAPALHYWRTINQTEVDFVVNSGIKLTGYECKYLWSTSKLPRALQSFAKEYDAQTQVLSRENYWEYLLTNEYT